MDYEIRPYAGVGPISLGMPAEEVRKTLHEPPEPVDKSHSTIPTDFFQGSGIFVYYRDPGVCEAVEFGGPISPTFEGQHFLGRPYSEIEPWVKVLDPEAELDDAGLTSYLYGFGLYAEGARKEPDLPIEGVIVFDEGYYNR